ncbi:carcinoembryonic antigen-related cell adhesion molecule 1 isoform X2 [Xenopus laevis]|uniref:Carcinoembryonic antigen-related cell adhesion molecule 1 isoform X2 n=1 Tax=Xenopus laevis TaxID=8355 RepID=A0A8J0TBQ4_XENLA|nr:carcinoembryonic antigen-related cell adhesion molecule 1 isoform X2 [Xenopus laevis]
MAREKAIAAQTLCMRGYLLTALFSVWINLISGIKIQPIPEHPVINQPVTLKVSGVRGVIRSFSWYKGRFVDDFSLILTYDARSNTVKTRGPEFFPRASGLPDGSLQISKLYKAVRRYYTVQIQADSLTQETINLPVYEILTKPMIDITKQQPEKYDEVTLTCRLLATELESVNFLWKRSDGRFPSGVKFSENNRIMTIPSFTQSDAGQYQCEVENQISKKISDPYTLSLYSAGVESINYTGIYIAIVAIVLIICATILIYMKKKYVSIQTTGLVNSGHDQTPPYQNVINGPTQNPQVESSQYQGLQHRPENIYFDLKMGGK